ncbi:MAG: GT4 family glycosyltransferase PelF [Anaerolineae bacterium]|nr:GT4 family glycosyltransferase PelF [Anaerolineae bacterium]
MPKNKPQERMSALMCTEGTYPYEGGGVSTWCDILCHQLDQVDYTLYAITGSPNLVPKYTLPPNIKKTIFIPLWGTQEPAEYILPDRPFSEIYQHKQDTTNAVIGKKFLPLLRRFLQGMEEEGDITPYGRVIYELWLYFQKYDWNLTWKSEPAWRAFVEEVLGPYEAQPHRYLGSEIPSMFDLTNTMRWMYNFLMPLNASVPKVDLVHSTIASFAGLAGIIAKHAYGTPFLVTEHGVSIRERYIAISATDFGYFAKQFLLKMYNFISRLIYIYADKISPVANFNQRWETLYTNPDKILTIYNGINPRQFTPKPKPAKTAHRPTAVAAARVFPLKDIETMIRSAAVAREIIPDVYFVVYGSLLADPPYVAKCRRLIAELNLEGTFEFGGFHNNPSEIYSEGDLSVLSSISEGFPFTVLESMACARPVVGTDVGGVREALEGFGIVVPPNDPVAFGEGVVTLLQNDQLRLELGRKAREEVILRYTTELMLRKYWQLYDEMRNLGPQKPPQPAEPERQEAMPSIAPA